MSTPTPTLADYERADRVFEAAERFAQDLPGFPRAVSVEMATLPELVDGRETWEAKVEACDWTAAVKVRLHLGADGEPVAQLVERYTHSIGTLDDVGDDYFVDLAAAEAAARDRSLTRRESVVIWELAEGHLPVAFVFDATIYRPVH